jgi:uncharacterized Ntn-hydrolase superfamily protein
LPPNPSTFSIVAVDPEAGEAGVAVQSKFLAAGAVVPWARGGVGAVATQAFADVTFGVRGLDLLKEGLEPQAVLDRLLDGDDKREERQVGIVDMAGRSATFTGTGASTGRAARPGGVLAARGTSSPARRGGRDGRGVPQRAGTARPARWPDRLVEALRAGQQGQAADRRAQGTARPGGSFVKPGGGYGGLTHTTGGSTSAFSTHH